MSYFATVSEINEYMNMLNVDYLIEGRVRKLDNGVETSYIINMKSININSRESSEWQKVVALN
jgi:hypothetical protein